MNLRSCNSVLVQLANIRKGNVVHYHRNDLVIEILQLLANPYLVFYLGMRNNEVDLEEANMHFCTCYGLSIFAVNNMTLH